MSNERKVKQVIVVRKDLNMRKGKIAAQAAHASLAVILSLMPEDRWSDDDNNPMPVSRWLRYDQGTALDQWLSHKFTKTVVSVDSEAELLEIYAQAKTAGLLASLIEDAGDTEFHGVKTLTTVAIGPDYADKIDPITGKLKLL
jgi:peptidyl-tRNA hydrolase, PTH2 family